MRKHSTISLLVAGLLTACGGSDGGGNPNPPTSVIAKAPSGSGDAQTGQVGQQLANSFCARVTESGSAQSGVTVNWSTTSGGAMSVPSSVTGADGVACSRLTLGPTAGAQTAQAALAGATGSPVTFNATADPGSASILSKVDGDNQSGDVNTDLAEALAVRITDAFGNGVGGEMVTWAVISGSATLNPLSGNSDGTGLATSVVTVGGTAGPIVITASALGLTGSPQTFNATGVSPPPPPSAITITVQNNSFSPQVDTVAVGGTVTWTWANTAGVSHSVTSTGPTNFVSDPAGLVASPHSYGPITFPTAGTYYYYCQLHGNPGNPPTAMSGTIVVR